MASNQEVRMASAGELRDVVARVGALTDGRLVTVDAGHLAHANRPDEFIHHLQTFLDG